MRSTTEVQLAIQASIDGLTLAELLVRHPGMARRTVQRIVAQLIADGRITALGAGRARRYFRAGTRLDGDTRAVQPDGFPGFIPLSADSLDIVA